MKSFIAVALAGCVLGDAGVRGPAKGDRKGRFIDWAANHNKNYGSATEFEQRMATWEFVDDVVTANNIRAAEKDAQRPPQGRLYRCLASFRR